MWFKNKEENKGVVCKKCGERFFSTSDSKGGKCSDCYYKKQKQEFEKLRSKIKSKYERAGWTLTDFSFSRKGSVDVIAKGLFKKLDIKDIETQIDIKYQIQIQLVELERNILKIKLNKKDVFIEFGYYEYDESELSKDEKYVGERMFLTGSVNVSYLMYKIINGK